MDPLTEQLAEALRKVQFGFNFRRCPECAGFNVGPNGETDSAHRKDCPVFLALAAYDAAKANGWDGVLDLLQRRCDAYENTLEDIRDDAGYNKESGLRAADVLRRWSALPPPPEQTK